MIKHSDKMGRAVSPKPPRLSRILSGAFGERALPAPRTARRAVTTIRKENAL